MINRYVNEGTVTFYLSEIIIVSENHARELEAQESFKEKSTSE